MFDYKDQGCRRLWIPVEAPCEGVPVRASDQPCSVGFMPDEPSFINYKTSCNSEKRVCDSPPRSCTFVLSCEAALTLNRYQRT